MTDPIAAIAEGVKLLTMLNQKLGVAQWSVILSNPEVKTIIAALTAAGEMAGEVVRLKEDIASWQRVHRTEYEKREALDNELAESRRAAAPASPVVEDVVEKVARAIAKANQNKSGMFNDEQMAWKLEKDLPMYRNLARAALAAIGRTPDVKNSA